MTIRLTKRAFMTATAALAFSASSIRAQASRFPGQMLSIRGTRLYVDDSGPKNAPALLYLHGGPGAGSYDFQVHQRDRLNKGLRVIIIDQRGVLRSDAIETLTMQDLIEDCEAVRQALGITRWSVVGHSFGGNLALRYAHAHPDVINTLAFENPCLDCLTSMQELMRTAAAIFTASGETANAAEVTELATGKHTAQELWGAFASLNSKLGDRRDEIYVHQPALRNFFGELVKGSGLTEEQGGRAGAHAYALEKEGRLFDDLRPMLKGLKMTALMLRGKYDHVVAPEQIDAFIAMGDNAFMKTFDNSAHFIHVEEPDAYAETLRLFASRT